MSAGEAGTEFPQHRAGRHRRQAEGIDAHIGVLAAIEFENVELHDAIDRGDQDLTPTQRERFVRRLKIGIADGIEDDVGALAVGEFADPRGNVACGSVDHLDLALAWPS